MADYHWSKFPVFYIFRKHQVLWLVFCELTFQNRKVITNLLKMMKRKWNLFVTRAIRIRATFRFCQSRQKVGSCHVPVEYHGSAMPYFLDLLFKFPNKVTTKRTLKLPLKYGKLRLPVSKAEYQDGNISFIEMEKCILDHGIYIWYS